MIDDLQQRLKHVVWIGGATDAGKTTVAQYLAAGHHYQIYHYDQTDLPHHEHLARSLPHYRAFLEASLETRWVQSSPADLMQRAVQSFRDRFPLVVDDLLALPTMPPIVAEGFGLTPELLAPILTSPHQAVWLIPTRAFKIASMARRNKPVWRDETSDPERAKQNLLERDILLAEHINAQARANRFEVYVVDGTESVEALAQRIARHVAPFLDLDDQYKQAGASRASDDGVDVT
jgi:hypothetical protein